MIGEFNVGNTATRLRVNATDTGAVRSNQSTAANSASVTNIYDVNRDGRVNATDTGIVRSNQQTAGIVAPLTVPGAIPPVGAFGMPPLPVSPTKLGGNPVNDGEGEGGFSGVSRVYSSPVSTLETGAPYVSNSISQLAIGQSLIHNELDHVLNAGTASAFSTPKGLGSEPEGSTLTSSTTDKQSAVDREREIVDNLFAGLAKENFGDFFS